MPLVNDNSKLKSDIRRLQHSKGVPNKVGRGIPSQSDGQDGDIQLSMTQTGPAIFAKIDGIWRRFTADKGPIGKIGDEVGGTVSNTVDYTGDDWDENDISSIVFKINEIIDAIQ